MAFNAKLLAYRWVKQGFDGSLVGRSPRQTLLQCGWTRSVGGVSPYLAIHGRSGSSREAIDKEVADLEILELPSARSCTYVLPHEQFGLALLMAQGGGEPAEIGLIKRYLGVEQPELNILREAVLVALEKGPLDPGEIKNAVGDKVRSFGEEGKKRGVSSSLPPVLGWLQTTGFIRRVPINGRLDQQRYKYVLWRPNPLEGFGLSRVEALKRLAALYFKWVGPASLAEFQVLAGVSGKAAKEAVSGLGLENVDELLILACEADVYSEFTVSPEPSYKLLGRIDPILNLVSGMTSVVDPSDLPNPIFMGLPAEKANSNLIFDRGRVVGMWDFEPETNEIIWATFRHEEPGLRAEIERVQKFVSEQLGDARTFSLDSPGSRKDRIKTLRAVVTQ